MGYSPMSYTTCFTSASLVDFSVMLHLPLSTMYERNTWPKTKGQSRHEENYKKPRMIEYFGSMFPFFLTENLALFHFIK